MTSTNLTNVASTAPLKTIPACPRCLSIEVEPVAPIPNVSVREAANTVWDDCWAGQSPLALRFLLHWGCVKAANILRDKHACRHCGLSFREVGRE